MRQNVPMQINLSQPLHTLRGEVFKRPTISLEQINGEPETVPMTLGHLLCESLPKALTLNSNETEKIKVVSLQKRMLKEGTQDLNAEEISLMKKGLFAFVSPEFSFLAVEAADMLEGKV